MEFTIEQLDLSTIQTLDDLFYSVSEPEGFIVYVYDIIGGERISLCPAFKDYIPSEQELVNKYGGGNYEVIVKHKKPGEQVKILKTLKFNYQGAKKSREITGIQEPTINSNVTSVIQPVQAPPAVEEKKPGFMGMNMEAMREFMQFITFIDQLRGGNKESEFGTKEILAMNEKHTQNLIEVLKGNNGGNSKMENFAFELLKEKRDPFLDLKKTKEMIDLFKGEVGQGESGGFFESIIEKIGVPLIGAAMSQNENQPGNQNIVLSPEDISTLTNAIIESEEFEDHLLGSVEQVLLDYGIIRRKIGAKSENAATNQSTQKSPENASNTQAGKPLKGDKTGKHTANDKNPVKRTETGLKSKSPNKHHKGEKQKLNAAQTAIIKAIKAMPINKQDELLKDMLAKEGYEKCKNFCVDNNLTESEDTFKQRMQSIGIDINTVKP